ncbi:hypothetical protein A2954_01315 [Candidatus Roizmanbacteria bacterium RIFCSPLOWO2_01_FULL_37_12]|uniref:NAD-dependent epimerase/dehydratase domain-containing protein n=1 Tax=Candidatus Roizmanbacteria bacterium RIFCSPLOWO2_01_FULL_37_12 TaxID=1802056 RepID=A0A1F7IGI2_9BACT|nr:MAG: hypothetical protein A3D76_05975 [Candidatus Roizmanbacteria bacterium RIFCSPHIGHO2_02_FULL_37_9b]OGK42464.1 MAG: hypothetical protein A2954_01315 [Candidatus Roizmanbacteria bacterium RIFCSPLOWO2_01_FULL_37_12]
MQQHNKLINKLKGPIIIFGAGGFVGFNLLQKLLTYRKDVFGVFSVPKKNWRLREKYTSPLYVVKCDIRERSALKSLISRSKPKTVFNLAAYGAYSTQNDINNIYQTNFNSTYLLLEEMKKYGFSAYVHAGSQSEYGLNSSGPSEKDELVPNSHYAVSKVASYYLLKYYGKVEKLPVAHLRLYSVYGSWEEPNRLIPTLIREAKKGKLPKFVDPNISRDFVYVEDVCGAFIRSAVLLKSNPQGLTKYEPANPEGLQIFGEAFNVCSGKKTTIKELAYLAKKLFKIKQEPKFGSMRNRTWDLKDWYGNPKKIQKSINWKARTTLMVGLKILMN